MKTNNNKGFTLVELMVVVAIIGVLSAVAIPNFRKYQAKSKSTEAKLNLAAIFTNELAFQADYDVFAACLTTMGYDAPSRSYYALGFAAPSGDEATAEAEGANNCVADAANDSGFDAGRAAGGGTPAAKGDLTESNFNPVAGDPAFVAQAKGVISPQFTDINVASSWTINSDKDLVPLVLGY